MDEFFSRLMASHFLRSHCQLYIIPEDKARNCCKIEAVIQSCSVKTVFLKIVQISRENPSARDSFLIKF